MRHWVPRSVTYRGSIDHTNCSVSCKLLRLRRELRLAVNFSCGHRHCGARAVFGRGERGARSAAITKRSAAPPAGRPRRVIRFAADHQLPNDARGLVGQGEGLVRPFLTCRITAVAPTTTALRKASSPARVIPPCRIFPAVE